MRIVPGSPGLEAKIWVRLASAVLIAQPASVIAQDSLSSPTSEQVKLVEERRASFPVRQLVEAVDWYQPLETVKGHVQPLPQGKAISREDQGVLVRFARESESFAVLIAKDGKLVYEDYGPGFTRTSRFDTASMHKAVLALLVGAAINDGAIRSVDDPLSHYLDNLPKDGRGAVTLRQLLEMSSGLRTPPLSDSAASPYWQTYFGGNLAWSIARWPMHPETTGQFYYANANTQYLLWVIERSTGRSYADYLSERLWRRIGAQEARLWMDRTGGSPRGFCCLQASGRDWLRVGELIRSKGRWRGRQVIAGDWVDAMLAPSPANPNFGRGIWRGSPFNPARTYGPGIPAVIRSTEPFARDDTVFIDGSGGQRVYIIPSAGLTIVRIGRPRADWDDSRLPNLVLALSTVR